MGMPSGMKWVMMECFQTYTPPSPPGPHTSHSLALFLAPVGINRLHWVATHTLSVGVVYPCWGDNHLALRMFCVPVQKLLTVYECLCPSPNSLFKVTCEANVFFFFYRDVDVERSCQEGAYKLDFALNFFCLTCQTIRSVNFPCEAPWSEKDSNCWLTCRPKHSM